MLPLYFALGLAIAAHDNIEPVETWNRVADVACEPTRSGFTCMTIALHGSAGAIQCESTPTQESSVVMFQKSGAAWKLQQELRPPPDSPAPFRFGATIALRGDHLLVGNPGEHPAPGVVYAYVRTDNEWRLQLPVALTVPESNTEVFIAMDGDLAAVRVVELNEHGLGAVIILRRDGHIWKHAAKLVPPKTTDTARNSFDPFLAISGNQVLVSGLTYSPGEESIRTSFLFTCNDGQWTFEREFRDIAGPSGLVPFVLASGCVIIPHERAEVDGLPGVGMVKVYRRNKEDGWVLSQTLTSPTIKPHMRFGDSIAASDGLLAISDCAKSPTGDAARVHVYRMGADGTWKIVQQLPLGILDLGLHLATDGCAVAGSGGLAQGNEFMKAFTLWQPASDKK